MDNIGDIVKNIIGRMAQRQPDAQHQLEQAWTEILDDKKRTHTRLVGIRDGKVSVLVDSPAWLYQMNISKDSILKKLREKVPEVSQIQFKVGQL